VVERTTAHGDSFTILSNFMTIITTKSQKTRASGESSVDVDERRLNVE